MQMYFILKILYDAFWSCHVFTRIAKFHEIQKFEKKINFKLQLRYLP